MDFQLNLCDLLTLDNNQVAAKNVNRKIEKFQSKNIMRSKIKINGKDGVKIITTKLYMIFLYFDMIYQINNKTTNKINKQKVTIFFSQIDKIKTN